MPGSTVRTAVALLGALLLALPAASAHTNHVEADPQVVADDRVRVEAVYALVDGWIVVHEANASGAPGEPIGHVAYDRGDGFRTDVPVPVPPSNGTLDGRLVVALHREAGGDGFDPDDDPILTRFGEPVVASFTADRGGAPVTSARRRSRPRRSRTGRCASGAPSWRETATSSCRPTSRGRPSVSASPGCRPGPIAT